jgi:hypothetical protein
MIPVNNSPRFPVRKNAFLSYETKYILPGDPLFKQSQNRSSRLYLSRLSRYKGLIIPEIVRVIFQAHIEPAPESDTSRINKNDPQGHQL